MLKEKEKLTSKWDGSFRVIRVIKSNTYHLGIIDIIGNKKLSFVIPS